MQSGLTVTDLTKLYGAGEASVRAVDGVSFSIPSGELWAVMGPSGSGKSTLLAMLGGLLTPTAGAVVVHGRPFIGMSRRALARFRATHVGFVFQANNLVPFLTTRENVEVMARISANRIPADRTSQLLEDLGISHRANTLATELSGGERQRATIARALVHDPDVLLVDEPTANLDTERGEGVVHALVDQTRRIGAVGVMVTHDPRMAALADVTLEMRDGRLTQ